MRYKLVIASYKFQLWGEKKTDMLSELWLYNSQLQVYISQFWEKKIWIASLYLTILTSFLTIASLYHTILRKNSQNCKM